MVIILRREKLRIKFLAVRLNTRANSFCGWRESCGRDHAEETMKAEKPPRGDVRKNREKSEEKEEKREVEKERREPLPSSSTPGAFRRN